MKLKKTLAAILTGIFALNLALVSSAKAATTESEPQSQIVKVIEKVSTSDEGKKQIRELQKAVKKIQEENALKKEKEASKAKACKILRGIFIAQSVIGSIGTLLTFILLGPIPGLNALFNTIQSILFAIILK